MDNLNIDLQLADMPDHQMPAKEQMIDFLTTSEFDVVYQFVYQGTEDEAKRHVHRMRNELSRLRKMVREAGRGRKPFTVKLISVEFDPESEASLVSLMKTGKDAVAFSEALDKALDTL